MFKKIKRVFSNPYLIVLYLFAKGFFNWVPDKQYLKIMYRAVMGKKLNLINPKTFNEKLQWLKLYDRNPIYTKLVDKYEVRDFVAKKIGEEYLIPLIGVYDSFDEIDFNVLPNQFVLKCTHNSGGIVICTDKSKLDKEVARKKINKSLSRNYYYYGREWPYKGIMPRIIAEKYITDTPESNMITDYKFYCFDGKVDSVMLCIDREKGDPKFYFFDKNWNLKRYNIRGKNAPEGFTIPKPVCIDEMFKIAEEFSKGIPFVRIDLYFSCGSIFFGEFTFYPSSGMDPNRLPEADLNFGQLVNLSKMD